MSFSNYIAEVNCNQVVRTYLNRIDKLDIQFPGKLIFGNGCLAQLVDEINLLQPQRILVISSTSILLTIKKYLKELTEIEILYDNSINKEPNFNDLKNIVEIATPFNPDIVLGIGGGSVLDIAKLVAAQLDNEQQLTDYIGIGLLKRRNKKLICIPTTSGSGSEVSPNAVVIEPIENQKKAVISPYLVADIVIVDPMLTITLPPAITAATGMDALTHCMEAYTNKFSLPQIDEYAYEGMKLIAANIVKAVNDGSNIEAREKVAMGSMLGGLCLGPVNTAGVHALSYPLGSMFKLAHGLSNALLLPYVMEFNIQASVKKYAAVAIALGCLPQSTEEETALAGVNKIKQLNKACNIPASLIDVGVKESDIEIMAKDAIKVQRLLKNNPREITEQDAIQIYKNAY